MGNRRDFLKTVSLGTAIGTLGLSSCITNNRITKITILHTNDVHSHIDPFPVNHRKFPNQGGFARRAALVKQIRKEEEHVLLLDAGDIFQGTPYFNFYKGELEIKLMGDMGYDAATIGNHEFDNGEHELCKQISKADFPFIITNYGLDGNKLKTLTHPYKIIQKGNIRIGIIGLGIKLEGLVSPNNYQNITYNNPIIEGEKAASFLKEKENCDYIIALSHLGYDLKEGMIRDIDVAKNTTNIDLILGGHSHIFLDIPTAIKNKADKKVYIGQTGWGGVKLGRIDIVFNGDKKETELALQAHL